MPKATTCTWEEAAENNRAIVRWLRQLPADSSLLGTDGHTHVVPHTGRAADILQLCLETMGQA